jgi:hypothetical protein
MKLSLRKVVPMHCFLCSSPLELYSAKYHLYYCPKDNLQYCYDTYNDKLILIETDTEKSEMRSKWLEEGRKKKWKRIEKKNNFKEFMEDIL